MTRRTVIIIAATVIVIVVGLWLAMEWAWRSFWAAKGW